MTCHRPLALLLAALPAGCGDDAGSGEATMSGAETSVSGGLETNPGSSSAASDPSDGSSATTDASSATDPADGTGTTDDPTGPPPGGEPELEGYGTRSTFGEGGELCTVTNLDSEGAGSLRDCVENRDTQDGDPTPRRIEFDVSGTIVLLQNLSIRQPHLTIDGLTSADPGITIEKTGDGSEGGIRITTSSQGGYCAHDVLIQGIRVRGVWEPEMGETGLNYGSLALDGEGLPGCLHDVVLNRVTIIGAQDSAGDIWGGVTDVTFQYSAFLESVHPNTWSHSPGGEAGQGRERISAHHNLYANNHERNPQIRASVVDVNYEQNIVHNWDAFGFGGGYGVRIRCRNGSCPRRLNLMFNHFTQRSDSPGEAIALGEAEHGDADEALIAPQVYLEGNRIPPENVDSPSAVAEFPRADEANVTIVDPSDVVEHIMPWIGMPYRSPEEDAIFEEAAQSIAAEM